MLDGNKNTTQYEYNTKGLLTKEINALGNTESYEYLADGLIKQITKADGTSSSYNYDKAGRMLDIIYSDGTKIDYGYNEIGTVTTMTDALGTTTYQYDDMQRLISTTDVNDKTVSYTYDILGRKTFQTLPDGQTVGYTYDVMDRLTKVYENDALLAEYEYDKNSQLIENNRNELKTTYEYDALGQLTEMTTVKGYEDIMNFTYEYDKIGNITSETRKEGDSTHKRKYLYDGANQLVAFVDNEYSETYSYDNAGNMLNKTINDVLTSYSYNEANQLIEEVTNSQTTGYKYNSNGDLVEKTSGEKYSYDIQGNMTAIVANGINQSFTYNGNGHRMSKTDDGETIYYVNDINLPYEQVLQTYGDDGQVVNTYTYGLERIQSKGQDNETYLYDGRGSVVGTINQDNILESYSYTAYGELMPSSPAPKVWGYNGEAQDSKTGMQYLRARYYSTCMSRFLQEDDYRGSFYNPISMNRYVYVHNNPVMGIDPSGYDTDEALYNAWKDSKIKYKSILREIGSLENNIMKYGGSKRKFRKRDDLYEKLEKALVAREKAKRDYFGRMGDGTSSADDNYYHFTITLAKAIYPGYIATNPNMCGDHHEYSLFKNQAGYWGGKFVNDGGASEMDKLRDAGVPESVILATWRYSFLAMSDKEVDNRNSQLDTAMTYLQPFSIFLENKLVKWNSDGEKHYHEAKSTLNIIPYSQNGRGNIDYILDKYENNDNFYIEYIDSKGKVMPRYGADCSSVVSHILGQVSYNGAERGGDNLSVYNMHYAASEELNIGDYAGNGQTRMMNIKIRKVGNYDLGIFNTGDLSTKNRKELTRAFYMLAPGDAIIKSFGGKHTKAILANDTASGMITTIEMTERGIIAETVKYDKLINQKYLPIKSN